MAPVWVVVVMPWPAADVAVEVAVAAAAAAAAAVSDAVEDVVAAEFVHAEERLGASTVAFRLAYMLVVFADVEVAGVEHSMAVADSALPVNCR